MSRRRLLPLAGLGILALAVVAFLLARYLTTESRERDAVYELLQAQARGDADAMLARLDGCADDGDCRVRVARNARELRRSGDVKILAYDSSTAYALGDARGPTRVAWTVVDRGLPVVQCVEVERTGSVLAGRAISLRRLSLPIDRQGSC